MMRHHAAHRVFTHTDVHHVWIAFGEGDCSDRTGLEETVRDVSPTDSHVLCFPETSASRSHVISFGIADDTGARVGSSATKRSDRSPFQRFENSVVVIRRRALRRNLRHKKAQKTH